MNLTPREMAELSDQMWVRLVNRVDGRVETLRPVTPTQHENFNVSPLRVENSSGTGSPARKIIVTPDSAVTFPGNNIIELAVGGAPIYAWGVPSATMAVGTLELTHGIRQAGTVTTLAWATTSASCALEAFYNGSSIGTGSPSGSNSTAALTNTAVTLNGTLRIDITAVTTAGPLTIYVY